MSSNLTFILNYIIREFRIPKVYTILGFLHYFNKNLNKNNRMPATTLTFFKKIEDRKETAQRAQKPILNPKTKPDLTKSVSK